MTPQARLAAAAEILDRYLDGEPAEKVLTNWARRSRFAGSKDRAAVRDHVFDAIRRRRSAAWLGGAETGRGLIIGLLRGDGQDPADFLTGEGHALPPLNATERVAPSESDASTRLDCPGWLEPQLRESLGEDFEPVMALMQSRAEIYLRVNIARTDVPTALESLAAEGVICERAALSPTALHVREGARALRNSRAYLDGLVEIQDAASQAVADAVPLTEGARVLDFCAGGGGKALALAARGAQEVFVHDANEQRMADIPDRARRAGASLTRLSRNAVSAKAPFDVVVADVPCSGSGAWRRQPEAKWRLDSTALEELQRTQRNILSKLPRLVMPDGCIAFMTCSLLASENEAQVAWFLKTHPGWQAERTERISPRMGGDGFFVAILRKAG